jgi:thiosulfate/3-mercaptopyruvate sulfurtransferase
MDYKEISTKELRFFIINGEYKIIDIRPIDAYNGWQLNGEKRNGHIKNAVSLPLKWAKYMDWIEIVRSKGINPYHKIVIYGYRKEDCVEVAKLFRKAGFKNIYLYLHFLDEWMADDSLPLDYLKNYQYLLPPSWLKAIIDKGEHQKTGRNKTVIVHAHYRNRDAYLTGHIPGAIDMNTLALESPETWNRRSPEELKTAFEAHGITSDTTVIVYGKFMWPDNRSEFPGSAAGHLGAIRCAMIMMYAGVRDVRVLNGGFQSWKDEGYEISKEDVPKQPVSDFGEKIPQYPEIIIDLEEAKEMIKKKGADIVSVRSWEEYIGNVSGYNYIEKKGRIPGSIFGNCGSDAYHMENYRNVDHTIREAQEVEAIWKEAGITPDKHLAFYCGTGWRGSEAFYNAWLMGWPKVSVFDGGWFEWSNDPNNPIEAGIP